MGLFRGGKKVTPEERKIKSNEKLKKLGIAYNEHLPALDSSTSSKLKSVDEICKRAIACLISTQLACDISKDSGYEESKELFSGLLKKYGVESFLIEKEARLFEGTYSKQDAIDVAWTYESYWALVWALKLIDNIEMPSRICDCDKAISLVCKREDFSDFKSKCRLRDVEEILDMLDLYYRYHWACQQKRLVPETSIGDLKPDVVWERRKGLEWLFSEEPDWNDIPLHT